MDNSSTDSSNSSILKNFPNDIDSNCTIFQRFLTFIFSWHYGYFEAIKSDCYKTILLVAFVSCYREINNLLTVFMCLVD